MYIVIVVVERCSQSSIEQRFKVPNIYTKPSVSIYSICLTSVQVNS